MRYVIGLTFVVALAAAVAFAGPAFAQAKSEEAKAPSGDYGQQVHDQFTRGATNVVTGPMSGFKEAFDESKQGDKNPAWPVTGAVKGTAVGVGRMGVGAFEAVTSPVPQKEPIIKPEVFDPEDKVNQGK